MALVLDGSGGISGVDGTASNPAIEGTDSNTGIFYPAADTVAIGTGGAERLRVVSAGDVGVGTSTPATISNRTVLSINNASNGGALNLLVNGTETLRLLTDNSSFGYVYNVANQPLLFGTNNTERGRFSTAGNLLLGVTSDSGLTAGGDFALKNGASIRFRNAADSAYLNMINVDSSNNLNFGVGGVPAAITFGISGVGEAARIDSSGNWLVATTGTTAVQSNTAGAMTYRPAAQLEVNGNATQAAFFGRTNDGMIVGFYESGTREGDISVSGTTVSYNGGHLSRYAQTQTAKDESLLKGTVLSNLDEMNVYTDADGNPVENEQLNKVKVSDVEGDANVAGVFVNWSYDERHQVDEINMAMTGDMIIRIAQGVTVQKGDLLMSAGDGTAKPQGDDIVRSKTVAKVTSNHVTCTYDDGSYCVPCVLMAC